MISIIGNGFVGNAIYQGLRNHYSITVYDIDETKSLNTFKESIKNEIIFICVPTPTNKNGEFILDYVENVVKKIPEGKILIIKSTITPAAANKLVNMFPNQNLVFNPEFLTERTAVEDFKNQKRIVLGGARSPMNKVEKMYKKVFPEAKVIKTDYKTACFIKYFCNCFFAAKVSLMNEFYQIAEAEGANWNVALDGLLSSEWVNPMHTQVPGPDGDYGFGGKCFPKDINAFIDYAENLDIDALGLKAAWNKNLEIRKNKNWLQIDGAVITKEKK
tara:strand:+ start:6750 stop:7571 length:822 start_codon:yes stop_codon:yes gene_type:complete